MSDATATLTNGVTNVRSRFVSRQPAVTPAAPAITLPEIAEMIIAGGSAEALHNVTPA
jgi:hypothetical protein